MSDVQALPARITADDAANTEEGGGQRPRSSVIPEAWPEHVPEAYYAVWRAAGRSVSRTCAIAEEQWEAVCPDHPYQPVATRTVYAWAQRRRWAERATLDLAHTFPDRHLALQAATIEAGEKGVAFLDALLAGAFDDEDPKLLRVKTDAARHASQMAGAGIFGTRDRVTPAVRPPAAETDVDFSAMSLPEILRYEAELVARSRTTLPDERRR